MMKHFTLLQFVLLALEFALSAQEIDRLPVYKSNYKHIVINYENRFLKYTDVVSVFWGYNILQPGFRDYKLYEDSAAYFINGINYRRQLVLMPNIDTVNTVCWVNGNMPNTKQDSINFEKKIEYSYILYKFAERRLNEDTIKKIRLLFPDDNISAQHKWYLCKVLFYKDSTVIMRNISDVAENTGRKNIKTYRKRLNDRQKKSLEKVLNLLGNNQGYECFLNNYYPALVEYFDGSIEHTYILSNKCTGSKELKQQYNKVIQKLWTFSRG